MASAFHIGQLITIATTKTLRARGCTKTVTLESHENTKSRNR
jgi:hypothetical protein